jgi:tRNA(Arg) A34 adenosine deaminase TadA
MRYANLITAELDTIKDQRWKLVAILVSKKPVAVTSNNVDKTHPTTTTYNSHQRLHAEIRCLRKAPKSKIKDSTMYVLRWSSGKFRLAKPCKTCMGWLVKMAVKRVIYSTDTGFEELRL